MMILYNAFGPNPRATRMFLLEKGIAIPFKEVNSADGDNRRPPYTDRNPGGQLPALELDNGLCIGETVAIWEYLEEKHPEPALIGATAEERAETRMWQRRIELRITENVYNGFRFGEGLERFKSRVFVIPEASSGIKAAAQHYLKWLEALMTGKEFIVGRRFTIVDLILFCALDFSSGVGQQIDPSLDNLTKWFQRMSLRPSAEASLHPDAARRGMRG